MKTILALASTLIILSSCAAGSSMATSKVYSDKLEGSSVELNEEALAKRGPNSSNANATGLRILSSEKLSLTELPTMVLAGLRKAYPTKSIVEITRHTGNQDMYYEFRLHERKHKEMTVVFNSHASQVSLP